MQRQSTTDVRAKEDDSGIIDLAAAAQSDPAGAERAQTTPLAKADLFDDEPASVRPSAPATTALEQPIPSMPPPSSAMSSGRSSRADLSIANAASVSELHSSASISSANKKSGSMVGLVIAGVIAAGAIAAGGFFYVKSRADADAAALAERPRVAPPAAVEAKPAPPAKTEEAPAAEPSVDPNALAANQPKVDETKTTAKIAAKGSAPQGAKAAAAAAPTTAAAPKEEVAAISQKDLPTSGSAAEGDLGKAMGKAVGADGKPVEATPAAGNGPQFAAGSVPQKPSQGAVTGAIGAVLSNARACLGPDDPVSRASITFASAGNVQSVTVTGGAAGKPAEACIKAALGNAKVAPFAEPTYSANITVRH